MEYQGHQPQNLRTPHHQSYRAKTRKQTPFLLDQLWSISCPQLLALPPRGPNICGLLHPTPTLAPQNATGSFWNIHSLAGTRAPVTYFWTWGGSHVAWQKRSHSSGKAESGRDSPMALAKPHEPKTQSRKHRDKPKQPLLPIPSPLCLLSDPGLPSPWPLNILLHWCRPLSNPCNLGPILNPRRTEFRWENFPLPAQLQHLLLLIDGGARRDNTEYFLT